ncbi:small conductance mechanosensitive channel [Oikeobacillus pervagus]|uniref:Small conductance mechanosensitive channel n=1 Tax=Oikeobacillus pervagus TaxID=1325931 RepID=A0AAJ1T248_9BACI|nr:mechanosensitive ion channel family protein [Oikeobacillus pervagus]MDQ0215407.1 small conductance mechanosensitive channel [Oikeobacillus pervagus]
MNVYEKMVDKLWEKFSSEDTWIAIGEGSLRIIITLLLAGIVVRIGRIILRNFFRLRSKSPLTVSERRENTLLKLLENIISYVVYFMAIINILEILTFNIKGLLAGAGVVGLAIGFGAQNLVRDVITGFFIIFEDQFSVGDYVRIGQFEGTVEEIGLRTTKIKGINGELNVLPNGGITEVTNFSIHNSIAIIDVSIAYESDIQKAEKVIEELLQVLPGKYEEIVAPPQLLGIQNLAASDIVLRITAETLPTNHWYIARMIRKEIKLCLDQNGIEIPYPRLVTYSRKEQQEKPVEVKHGGE